MADREIHSVYIRGGKYFEGLNVVETATPALFDIELIGQEVILTRKDSGVCWGIPRANCDIRYVDRAPKDTKNKGR